MVSWIFTLSYKSTINRKSIVFNLLINFLKFELNEAYLSMYLDGTYTL